MAKTKISNLLALKMAQRDHGCRPNARSLRYLSNVGTGSLKAHLNIPKSLQAPIVQNQKVGTLELNFDNKAVSSPVYALRTILKPAGGAPLAVRFLNATGPIII